jgi:hypothetical protein
MSLSNFSGLILLETTGVFVQMDPGRWVVGLRKPSEHVLTSSYPDLGKTNRPDLKQNMNICIFRLLYILAYKSKKIWTKFGQNFINSTFTWATKKYIPKCTITFLCLFHDLLFAKINFQKFCYIFLIRLTRVDLHAGIYDND